MISKDFIKVFKEAEGALLAARDAYFKEREGRLTAAVVALIGRTPDRAEIAIRGKRLIWPDGHVDWMWDKTLILTEHPPKFGPPYEPA